MEGILTHFRKNWSSFIQQVNVHSAAGKFLCEHEQFSREKFCWIGASPFRPPQIFIWNSLFNIVEGRKGPFVSLIVQELKSVRRKCLFLILWLCSCRWWIWKVSSSVCLESLRHDYNVTLKLRRRNKRENILFPDISKCGLYFRGSAVQRSDEGDEKEFLFGIATFQL